MRNWHPVRNWAAPRGAGGQDLALAGALAAWSLAEVATGTADGPAPVAVAAGLAMSLPLLWRRRAAVLVALVVTAAFTAEAHLGVDTRTQVSTVAEMLAAAYAVAAYSALPAAAVVGVVQVLAGATVQGSPSPSGTLFAGLVVGAGWAAGRAMRLHRRRSRRLGAAVLEEQQRARTAAQEERTRIARELHDIVAHAVSIMVIQAGAGSEVLPEDPAAARQALDSIQTTGRQALEELRRLLGVLHADTEPSGLAPQPGIAQLPALAEQVRAAGLAVRLTVEENLPELPASEELAVYRIVQEALTNTVKHAGASRADVEVTCRGDVLAVDVVDDGHGGRARRDRGGHGLSGMEQRVAMYGGSLSAEGTADGFRVRARLLLASGTAMAR